MPMYNAKEKLRKGLITEAVIHRFCCLSPHPGCVRHSFELTCLHTFMHGDVGTAFNTLSFLSTHRTFHTCSGQAAGLMVPT